MSDNKLNELNELTSRDFELAKMLPIADLMPVHFENGKSWSEYKGQCSICNECLPDELVTGSVIRFNSSLVSIEAVGRCVSCRVLTRFTARLRDDMTMQAFVGNKWVDFEPTPKSPPINKALLTLMQPAKWLSVIRNMGK